MNLQDFDIVDRLEINLPNLKELRLSRKSNTDDNYVLGLFTAKLRVLETKDFIHLERIEKIWEFKVNLEVFSASKISTWT